MSSEQVLYDDEGRKVGRWKPHLMIYYPHLTSADVGLGGKPSTEAAVVVDPGKALSNIMIVVRSFTDGRRRPRPGERITVTATDLEDRPLASAVAASGDEAAFRTLYRRHTPALYRLALRLGGGDEPWAEELVQRAWIRAVEGLGGFGWRSALSTWLGGIAVNCARELWREGRLASRPRAVEAPAVTGCAPGARWSRRATRIGSISTARSSGSRPGIARCSCCTTWRGIPTRRSADSSGSRRELPRASSPTRGGASGPRSSLRRGGRNGEATDDAIGRRAHSRGAGGDRPALAHGASPGRPGAGDRGRARRARPAAPAAAPVPRDRWRSPPPWRSSRPAWRSDDSRVHRARPRRRDERPRFALFLYEGADYRSAPAGTGSRPGARVRGVGQGGSRRGRGGRRRKADGRRRSRDRVRRVDRGRRAAARCRAAGRILPHPRRRSGGGGGHRPHLPAPAATAEAPGFARSSAT